MVIWAHLTNQIHYIYWGHQTRQEGDLPWQGPTLKIALCYDQVTQVKLRDTLKHLNPNFSRFMASKLSTVLTSRKKFRMQMSKSSATSYFAYLMHCCCRRVSTVSLDTLEKNYVINLRLIVAYDTCEQSLFYAW